MRIANLSYDFDDKLSLQNFSNMNFTESRVKFSGKAIYGTLFYNETPDSSIFPPGTTGMTLVNCNVDNLILPLDTVVIFNNGLQRKRFKVQNDGNDWIIDDNNLPVKPLGHKLFMKLGLPVPDPTDIPLKKSPEIIDLIKVAQAKVGIV